MSTDKAELRRVAIRLLSRREYSQHGLHEKLVRRFGSSDGVAELVTDLVAQKWLSDERYADMYCQSRLRQGYGPIRIQQHLSREKIDHEAVASALKEYQAYDMKWVYRGWQKRFNQLAVDQNEQRKQTQFLLYRGFSSETVSRFFKQLKMGDYVQGCEDETMV